MLLQNRFPVASQLFHAGGGNNRVKMQDQSNEEEALGGEVSGQVRLAENNRATVGLKVVHAIIGPNRDARFDIAANTPTAPDSSDSTVYPYVGVQSGTDNTIAGYFEDTWDLNARKTTLFAGARVEYNDFREKRTLVLPRGGVVHSLTGRSTVKYVFNTGYLRPNAVYSKTTGIIVDEIRGPSQGILLVDKSEQILNHEVQWYWRGDRGFLAANAFYMSIANYISFDASHTPQGYKNLGDARSRGVEVEGRWQAGDAWDLYANYSFVHADLHETRHQGALTDQHNETLNYPSHLGNLGVNWCDGDQDGDGDGERTINVNLNGWRSMPYVKPLSGDGSGGTFSSLAGEAYLDVDFHQARLFGTSVDLSVFCTNVLDNTHRVGMIVNNGVWYPRGRNAGASLEYRW
jgi:outer membrane receptor protein involved in Fe transport